MKLLVSDKSEDELHNRLILNHCNFFTDWQSIDFGVRQSSSRATLDAIPHTSVGLINRAYANALCNRTESKSSNYTVHSPDTHSKI